MGLFDRFRRTRRPAWASEIFRAREWDQFRELLLTTIPHLGADATLDEDEGIVEVTIEGKLNVLGLVNLSRRCRARPPPEWQQVIDDWVRRVVEQLRFSLRLMAGDLTWDEVGPLLRVQLYNAERAAATPRLIARQLAEDLYLAVVIDRDESMISVTDMMLGAWRKPDAIVLDHAIANLGRVAIEIEWQRGGLPAPLVVAASDDDFGAARTFLDLEDVVGDTAHGALWMVPTRFTTVLLPIEEPTSLLAVTTLLHTALQLHDHDESPVTPHLYWWRAGTLTTVPYRRNHGRPLILWPAELDPLITAS